MPSRFRSRKKSHAGKPALIVIVLLAVVLAGWFWQQRRGEAPPAAAESPAASTSSQTGVHSESLPLPPPGPAGPASAPAAPATATPADTLPGFLPPEARQTLRSIAQGGPFPHQQDGSVFANREGRLPRQARGYYREYTVDTPGLNHRGTRRIVTGGQAPREYYYTDDHYESFRRFEIGPPGVQR